MLDSWIKKTKRTTTSVTKILALFRQLLWQEETPSRRIWFTESADQRVLKPLQLNISIKQVRDFLDQIIYFLSDSYPAAIYLFKTLGSLARLLCIEDARILENVAVILLLQVLSLNLLGHWKFLVNSFLDSLLQELTSNFHFIWCFFIIKHHHQTHICHSKCNSEIMWSGKHKMRKSRYIWPCLAKSGGWFIEI